MDINKNLNILFRKYESKYNFFTDGVFDESKFKSSRVKILFLLKEVNNDGIRQDRWDLRKIIKERPELCKTSTWLYAGKIYYILNNKFPPYDQIESLQDRDIVQSVNSIASINLSKKAGTGNADDTRIIKEATENFGLWKSQIDIIKPDIVICGGTFEIIQRLFIKNKIIQEKEIKKTVNGMNHFYYKNMLFIDFVHPSFFGRCRFSFGYSFLKEGIKLTKAGKIARL